HRQGVRPDPPVGGLLGQERKDMRLPRRAHPGRRRRHAPDTGRYRDDENAARHDGGSTLRLRPDQSGHTGYSRPPGTGVPALRTPLLAYFYDRYAVRAGESTGLLGRNGRYAVRLRP